MNGRAHAHGSHRTARRGCVWPAGATPAVEGGVACDPAAPPAEEDAFWPIRSSGLREAALRPSARCRST
eukprot:14571741-Alexandrium_andersonii.AAC.1